jgi:hypothetical protein
MKHLDELAEELRRFSIGGRTLKVIAVNPDWLARVRWMNGQNRTGVDAVKHLRAGACTLLGAPILLDYGCPDAVPMDAEAEAAYQRARRTDSVNNPHCFT